MSLSQPTSAQRYATRVVLIGVILALVLSALAPIRSTSAQQRRRVFDSEFPKQIPLKVKIKKDKEAAALDLTNKNWFRDIEIEVTNTSNKPIYYLRLDIIIDVSNDDMLPMVFPLRWGRPELADVDAKPGPDDIHIKPKATQVLTFPTHIVSILDDNDKHEWEAWRDKYKKDDPMKLTVSVATLSYGNGNGFATKRELVPIPN
jgi:hypothetical protein